MVTLPMEPFYNNALLYFIDRNYFKDSILFLSDEFHDWLYNTFNADTVEPINSKIYLKFDKIEDQIAFNLTWG